MKYKITLLSSIISVTLMGCGGDSSSDTPVKQQAALVKITELGIGDQHCDTGGVQVDTGIDENDNNMLDSDELLDARYYCNDGTRVEDGDEGLYGNSIVTVLSITKEDAQCTTGGQHVLAGIDKNENNTLDKTEITDDFIMCNLGDYTAPELMINSVIASSAIVAPGSTVTLTANISNVTSADTLYWFDSNGNKIAPSDENVPSAITVTVSDSEGAEEYELVLHRKKEGGDDLIQTKKVSITVGSAAKEVKSVQLGNSQVLLPDGYKEKKVNGDITGVVLYGDEISNVSQQSSIPTPDNVDLMGFVNERPSLEQGDSAQTILDSMIAALPAAFNYYVSVDQITRKQLPNGDVSASYNIEYKYGTEKISNTLDTILQTIGMNKVGGSIDSLVPSETEIEADKFQFDIVVSYDQVLDNLISTATLIDKSKFEIYSTLINATTSESISAPIGAELKLQTEKHTAVEQTAAPADFLFVIDNSGSMGDEQNQISLMTDAFIQAITNKGIDYKVGTITTDSDELRGVGFTSDKTQIENDFKPGTWGSPTERGIYYSEKALEPSVGTVALDGYPRDGASLSVIVMSDEPSQYALYGSPEFNPLDNLFIDNQYLVYSIIKPGQNTYSQYDDLAFATYGEIANIDLTSEYETFMDNIVEQSGTSIAYPLQISSEDGVVVSPSIAVTIEGNEIVRSSENGWEYNPAINAIQFSGAAIPTAGVEIEINYNYYQ